MGMDIQMSELQRSDLHQQPGDGRGGEASKAGLVFRTETEKLLQLGKVSAAEEYLQHCSDALEEARKLVRGRRASIEASRCAICRKGFPDGRPYGNEKLRRPGEEALDVYACSATCFSQLQMKCEQKRLELYDEDSRAARAPKAEDPRRRRTGRPQMPI